MTFEQFQGKVMERRTITGEGYGAAAKAVLAFLLQSRMITEEQHREFERKSKGGH